MNALVLALALVQAGAQVLVPALEVLVQALALALALGVIRLVTGTVGFTHITVDGAYLWHGL